MTAALAPRRSTSIRPDRTPVGARSRKPELRVLDQEAIRKRARRRNAALALFIVAMNGLFGVAFVHARLVENQQELDLMRARIAELEVERTRVQRAVDEASAPAVVVSRATEELGMVRAAEPVYLAPAARVGSG